MDKWSEVSYWCRRLTRILMTCYGLYKAASTWRQSGTNTEFFYTQISFSDFGCHASHVMWLTSFFLDKDYVTQFQSQFIKLIWQIISLTIWINVTVCRILFVWNSKLNQRLKKIQLHTLTCLSSPIQEHSSLGHLTWAFSILRWQATSEKI